MKKFTKVALFFSAFFAIVGVISFICAFTMGLTWNELKKMAGNGDLAVQIDDSNDSISFFKYENHDHHEKNHCKNLDVHFSAGTLNFYYDNVDEIEVRQEGIKNFSSRMDGDTLEISGGKGLSFGGKEGVITIIVPQGTVFEEVDLSIGAGQADVDGLCAKEVSVDVGAGQVKFSFLDIKHFDAETDAGQIIAHFVESEEAYNYNAECSIGEIQIGNSSIGGLGGKKNVSIPEADRYLDLECGVGQIIVSFEE